MQFCDVQDLWMNICYNPPCLPLLLEKTPCTSASPHLETLATPIANDTMMILTRPSFLLFALLLVSKSLQQLPSDSQLCAAVCSTTLNRVKFNTTVSTDDYYTGFCKDTLRFSSIFFCIRLHCLKSQIQTAVDYMEESCHTEVHIETPSYDSVIAGFSDEAISAIPVIGVEPSGEIVNVTVVPSDEAYDLALKTWRNYIRVDKEHFTDSWVIYGFWGIVLLIGLANRLFAYLVRSHISARKPHNDTEAINRLQTSKSSSVDRWFRSHILLPATFGYRHQEPWGWCTIPTRIQSLTVFAFVVLNLLLCAVGKYGAFEGNYFWSAPQEQTWTYVTDRAGFLAVANLPLLWLFAGRNDIFLWLTGWNFGTFNIFHRYVARIVTIEAIIHAIGYTSLILKYEGKKELYLNYKEEYWYCGVISTTGMALLVLLSIYPIRQKAYEVFLALHVSLAVIVLVTLFYHIKIWNGKFEPFLWPCVALWVFDHFVRCIRVLVLNFKVIFLAHTKVLAVYNAEHDIIRLTFTPSYHSRPTAGTHYYLHFPFILKAVGNHPFTMSSWSESGQDCRRTSAISTSSISKVPEKGNISPTVEVNSRSSASIDSKVGSTKIHFVIRPYKGMTARLRDSIVKSGTGSQEMTALIEGPYGGTEPVFDYNNIIFIAGGSGISAVLPYVQEFLDVMSTARSTTTRVHIVWAARQRGFIQDVLETELATAAKDPRVKLDIFLTGASTLTIEEEKLQVLTTRVRCERPDIKSLLHREVGESVGTVAVFVCGAAALADDARRASVEIVGRGFKGLGYFEEQFGW